MSGGRLVPIGSGFEQRLVFVIEDHDPGDEHRDKPRVIVYTFGGYLAEIKREPHAPGR